METITLCVPELWKKPTTIYIHKHNYSFGKGLIDIKIAENPVIDVLGKNGFWKYNNYKE